MKEKQISDKKAKMNTILAFTIFFVAFGLGVATWFWLKNLPKQAGTLGGTQMPLREGLNFNEQVFGSLFSQNKLVKTYAVSEAVKQVRVNGNVGMRQPLDSAAWKLQVLKSTGDTLNISMDEIKKLPKIDLVFEFKCIEGWSQKTWWGGVKFVDFIKAYGLQPEAKMTYVGMVTPDGQYYVGLDMPSALHPQTILCYEMNGKPLPFNQGYPLRLIIPVKYGIKHIKRLGTITFSNQRPRDYWSERGYDYYSGH
jgi:DMSO/TMAO reductase YedYZ molybdopterin-dependent catalytic subunit